LDSLQASKRGFGALLELNAIFVDDVLQDGGVAARQGASVLRGVAQIGDQLADFSHGVFTLGRGEGGVGDASALSHSVSPASPLNKGADMTCGEELIMFNERVLKFQGGASIPCRKGAQPKN
jgi:hypothetical protein